MSLKSYTSALMRSYVLVVLFAIAGILLGLLYYLLIPRTYTAVVSIYVSAQSAGDNAQQAYQGSLLSEQRIASYVSLVGNPRIDGDVARSVGAPDSPASIAGKVSAYAQPNTVLLFVSASDGSPERAAEIANAASTSFASLVGELEQPAGRQGPPAVVARIIQPAAVPDSASAPVLPTSIAVGLIIGIFLGCAVAVVRDVRDNSVKSQGELAIEVDAPALGEVPTFNAAELKPNVRLDQFSEHLESYRRVRANLQFLDVDRPLRTFVVTSASPGEGKTTTAMYIAVALRDSGERVLLVEADLRRPGLSTALELEAAVGLSSVLAGKVSLESAVQQPYGLPHVLPSGPIPPNPNELLSSDQMVRLIEHMKTRYDTIVFDSPPLLAVSDAAILATRCDGALIVGRYGSTTTIDSNRVSESLKLVGARILGVVLNRMPARTKSGYGAYASYRPDRAEGANTGATVRATINSESSADVTRPSPLRRR